MLAATVEETTAGPPRPVFIDAVLMIVDRELKALALGVSGAAVGVDG
ncbi:hypothetical protein [Thiohalocapsa marina]